MLQPAFINSPDQLPATQTALRSPDGLLAVGGQVTVDYLINFYPKGVYPCYSDQEPILWWTPWQRWVLFSNELRVNRSLKKALRRQDWQLNCNQNFEQVLTNCAAPRKQATGQWLNTELQQSMLQLHQQGLAHSIELYLEDQLVGGFYGLKFGEVFFGESMFSLVSDASKVALAMFCLHQPIGPIKLIDCQQRSNHCLAMGARCLARHEFEPLLRKWTLL